MCTPCQGSFNSGTGNSACTQCSPGNYGYLGYGQTTCSQSAAGRYSDIAGAWSPSECAIGRFNNANGQSTCSVATAGSYIDTIGSTASSLKICPTGQYQNGTAATSACHACAPGKYSDSTGASVCTTCDGGGGNTNGGPGMTDDSYCDTLCDEGVPYSIDGGIPSCDFGLCIDGYQLISDG
jgi:hypothetical protein